MNQPCNNIAWLKDSKSSIVELCWHAIGQKLNIDTDSSQVGVMAVAVNQG